MLSRGRLINGVIRSDILFHEAAASLKTYGTDIYSWWMQ